LSEALTVLAKEEGLRLTYNTDDTLAFTGDRNKPPIHERAPLTVAFERDMRRVHLVEGPADRGELPVAKNVRLRIEDILKRIFGLDGFPSRREYVTKSPLA